MRDILEFSLIRLLAKSKLVTILRLVVFLTFLYSSYTKFLDIPVLIKTIQSLNLFPVILTRLLSIILPTAEALIAFGVLSTSKRRVNVSTFGMLLLVIGFTIVIVLKWGQVLPSGCGCFGNHDVKIVGLKDLLIDIGLIVTGCLILFLNRAKNSGSF